MHNFLQEKIMHFEGFKYGWFLGFLEVRPCHMYNTNLDIFEMFCQMMTPATHTYR